MWLNILFSLLLAIPQQLLTTELLEDYCEQYNSNLDNEMILLEDEEMEEILLYNYRHAIDSIYELQLIPMLTPQQVQQLVPLVQNNDSNSLYPMLPKAWDIFHHARHEIRTRLDARSIENHSGDPIYGQLRYRFNYANRIQAGLQITRPTGVHPRHMRYAAFLEIHDLGPMRTLVGGGYQASFGCGLVVAPAFHMGLSMYATSIGMAREGLHKYASTSKGGLHGIGTTFQVPLPRYHHLDVSAFYSLTRQNDSTLRHVVGANLTYRYKKMKVGITAVEKIYSDSLQYYTSTAYNQHYFRGRNQAVIGLNFRYNFGQFDLFGEVATAQSSSTILTPRWGIGTNIGLRIQAPHDIQLMVLARYYSLTFDNDLGYGASQTSRLGDELGVLLSGTFHINNQWQAMAWLDLYRYQGVKYAIAYAPSYGYDARTSVQYNPTHEHQLVLRLRARERAHTTTFTPRLTYTWRHRDWLLNTRMDFTMAKDGVQRTAPTYGYAIMQDVQYHFQRAPIILGGRVTGFHIPTWSNRIYAYENDVLGSFSIPSLYGRGARAYLNLRWQALDHRETKHPIKQLVVYFRLSETIYTPSWARERKYDYLTRTEAHLMVRMVL